MERPPAFGVVAALIALPASASASRGGGQVPSLTGQQCSQERAGIGKKAFRSQDELAQVGPADFIDEYSDDPTDLNGAMEECVAEDVDQILSPDDSVADLTDGADS